MGEFRIGRKYAQHSYPDTPRGASAAFARNSAVGPNPLGQPVSISTTGNGIAGDIDRCGTHVPWSIVESTGAAGASVPITPRVTGRVRALATVVVQSVSEGTVLVQMGLFSSSGGGPFVPILHVVEFVLAAGDLVTIPLVFDGILPLNVTTQVALVLRASAGGAQMAPLPPVCSGEVPVVTATIDLQELPPPTG